MRWQTNYDFTKNAETNKPKRIKEIINAILSNRDLNTRQQITHFLDSPHPQTYSSESVGLNQAEIKFAASIIRQAIDIQQPIIVFGDYDADGITATAILWETLHHLGAKAIPFIPSREKHGYGLSIKGLEDALKLVDTTPLIITVDNGIVAQDAALWLQQQNIPLIITDHHTKGEILPQAKSIVHSDRISGAGVSWFVSKELSLEYTDQTLDLAAIGTIADMMPLLDINRSFAKFGLQALSQTHRPGIKELLKQADIDIAQSLTPYHINYIIAPRLNAMGRLEHALESLRLVCTKNQARAELLAQKLGSTNRTRQDLTQDLLIYAKEQVDVASLASIIVVDDEKFHEGIIGLIAGKLAETFYRPSIVISKKEGISKASARSIKGVNITKLIRAQSHLLLGVGGHPMAAGFSIETEKIELFKQSMIQYAQANIDPQNFDPILDIDCLLNESDLDTDLLAAIKQLEPFGIGNKEPVFAIKDAEVISAQSIGKTASHLKFQIKRNNNPPLQAIWFNPPQDAEKIKSGDSINLAGTISLNTWRNKSSLQFMVKDMTSNN